MPTDIEGSTRNFGAWRNIARRAGIDNICRMAAIRRRWRCPCSGSRRAGKGKLILVTAHAHPAGEGKTTTTIGLADGLRRIGKKRRRGAARAVARPGVRASRAVRPAAATRRSCRWRTLTCTSPVIHAIGAANNLLAAMLDNHIQQGNALGIDPRRVTWRRCVDINDRQLRCIVDGLGGRTNGVPREDGFDITVASEIMAVLCLAEWHVRFEGERLSASSWAIPMTTSR